MQSGAGFRTLWPYIVGCRRKFEYALGPVIDKIKGETFCWQFSSEGLGLGFDAQV